MDIQLSKAIDGYLLDARARQLSDRTIEGYERSMRRFLDWIDGDPIMSEITADDIRRFQVWLGRVKRAPAGIINRPPQRLSKKSILNIHIALSALWTWAGNEGFVDTHIVRSITPPRPEKRAIEPFSKNEVTAMLEACERTEEYDRPGKATCSNARPTANRDKAMILLLLDTGMRASEMVADPPHNRPGLRICDVDERNKCITVFGKGDKERVVMISHKTLKALWRYLLTRPDAKPTDALFASSRTGRPLTVSGLGQTIRYLGDRCGIHNAHPHRFRHTFAINFLRNGGKTLELQRLLGHTTLDMVKRYVKLAQVDLEKAHQRASPVANWF
jgi:site-specific recombinase XerD